MYRISNKYLVLFAVMALVCLSAGIASAATVTNSITYQGKLTNAAGGPQTGIYTMTFRLYGVSTGGTALDTRIQDVPVTNGDFTTSLAFNPIYYDSRALWLGVKIGTDSEMTPRMEIRPVPYALSLRPGASITSADASSALNLQNIGGGKALNVSTNAFGSKGIYVVTNGQQGTAIHAIAKGIQANAVVGETTADGPAAVAGVTTGKGSFGLYGKTTGGPGSIGVYTITSGPSSAGVYTITTGDNSNGVHASVSGKNSNGIDVSAVGTNNNGISVVTTSSGSRGVNIYTGGAGSHGVDIVTAASHSYGVNVTTNAMGSKGISAVTSGQQSPAIHAIAKGSNSNAIFGETSADGPASPGFTPDNTTAIRGFASGDNSAAIAGVTTGTKSNGISVYTSGPESRGITAITGNYSSPGIMVSALGYASNGIEIGTIGEYSHGMEISTFGVDSYGAYVVSDKAPAIYAQTNRGDHKYGVQTRDIIRALGYETGSSDVAEYMPVTEDVVPGTVLVISPDGKLRPSASAYDPRVAGIVSTDPGVFLGAEENGNPGEEMIAISGRVPCKVDASYGAIRAGDLLTSSVTSGYAMKAEPTMINGRGFYPDGTILGKAMGTLESGTGTIEVLVTLQ